MLKRKDRMKARATARSAQSLGPVPGWLQFIVQLAPIASVETYRKPCTRTIGYVHDQVALNGSRLRMTATAAPPANARVGMQNGGRYKNWRLPRRYNQNMGHVCIGDSLKIKRALINEHDSAVSLTQSKGGAYHFQVAAFSTPAASLSSVTARRLTSLHKPLLGHRKEFYRHKEAISRRPSTMFPDHDNPTSAAAAPTAQNAESEKAKAMNDGNPANG